MERSIDEWGRSLFRGEDAIELLFQGHDINKLAILPSPEIDAYNAVCVNRDKLDYIIDPVTNLPLSPAEDTQRRQAIWWIPDAYQRLDVRAKLLEMCETQVERDRVLMEMRMFEARDFVPVLRLICFLVDRWRERGVVWGVGRGSSVASYCLFLIGIHRIDALRYGLDITEFLK